MYVSYVGEMDFMLHAWKLHMLCRAVGDADSVEQRIVGG